jgi:DNA invertase Pin-like site-specific DNA recombinase
MPEPPPSVALIPVIAYVRISTEYQEYSTGNQLSCIKEYAATHGMEILRIYADEGKSGLQIKGRKNLQQMLDEVDSGKADFKAILVYDVSRWGRFQDLDEGGHYEYQCKKAGIAVHFCAEQFENDGSPSSGLLKNIKRHMSGEYSRDLSNRVFYGACRLVQLGFRQGGTAGFGLRRMMIDTDHNQKQELKMGEHKFLQTDRVILIPGPKEEQDTVLGIFQSFVLDGVSEREIANNLNARGVLTDFKRSWTRGTVHQILVNEKYIGNNVYHKTSFKLKQRHIKNPNEDWIRADGAFDALVPVDLFWRARGIIESRSFHLSDDEMLKKLKIVFQKHNKISALLIDEQENMPSSSTYRSHFDGLLRAYALVGYTPETDFAYIEVNRRMRKQHPELVLEVVNGLKSLNATVNTESETGVLLVNQEYRVAVVLSRYLKTESGQSLWCVRFEHSNNVDITIAARMNEGNTTIRDYYLLPQIIVDYPKLRLSEDNGTMFDRYRFNDLHYFFALAERVHVECLI